uniref:Link domain-containing protein n=1 Tax=Hippocampus comes TaxID=109280 RepID=A0A3Q3DTU9_HIPCM
MGQCKSSLVFGLCCTSLGISAHGIVFHLGSDKGFTYDEAATLCLEQNASLASTGELHAAWKQGFDKCRPGWLRDRSVRYPITYPRAECGAGKSGVHTVYIHPNLAGPDIHDRFDAYCFKAFTDLTESSFGEQEASGFSLSNSGEAIPEHLSGVRSLEPLSGAAMSGEVLLSVTLLSGDVMTG